MSTVPGELRLLVVGDVHTRFGHLESVLDHGLSHGATAVAFVGDLACAGWQLQRTEARKVRYRELVDQILDQALATGLPVVLVPGNHDLPDLQRPENIDGRRVELGGLRIAGFGGAGPARFGFAYEWGEEEAAAALSALPPCEVLLAHCPPLGTTLDRTARGAAAGSQAVRDWALAHEAVLLCGHIHEAPGVEQLGDTLCLNAGGLGRPFGRAQAGWVIGEALVAHCDLETGRWTSLRRGEAPVVSDDGPPWG